MRIRSIVRTCLVVAAALIGAAAWAPQAAAESLLEMRYTGVVTEVADPFGVFAGVALGDSVSGMVRYSTPIPPPMIAPGFASYEFPVTPGGGNGMSVAFGSYDLRARETMTVGVFTGSDDTGAAFFLPDADLSILSTAGLPAGYRLTDLNVSVYLRTSGPSEFPAFWPPTELLPLYRYDLWSDGYVSVNIWDETGQFVDSANLAFHLTGMRAIVPEPGSLSMVGVGGVLLGALGWRARVFEAGQRG